MSEITRETIEQASGDELNRLVERLVFQRKEPKREGVRNVIRDFLGDGNRERELVAEIVRRGWVMSSCSPGLHISRWECFLQAGLGSCIVSKTGSTQAEALCRAACLACLEEA